MSKASEWAEHVRNRPRRWGGKDSARSGVHAEVSDFGELMITLGPVSRALGEGDQVQLSQAEALSLAEWIYDTFAEPSR